jgi:hypothetical protein
MQWTITPKEGEPSSSGIADWGEAQHIPSKWITPDGKQLYLVFSAGDSFAVRGAVLTVNGGNTAHRSVRWKIRFE